MENKPPPKTLLLTLLFLITLITLLSLHTLSPPHSSLPQTLLKITLFTLLSFSLLSLSLSLFPSLSRSIIFLHRLRPWMWMYGLEPNPKTNVFQHRLKTSDNLELGVWVVNNRRRERQYNSSSSFSSFSSSSSPSSSSPPPPPSSSSLLLPQLQQKKKKVVIIYFHGNAETRAQTARQDVYQSILRSFSRPLQSHPFLPPSLSPSNYEIDLVTFDYRGFGDSEGSPSEEGLVVDGMAIYQFAIEEMKADSVFFWGHSLGSGVSTRVAKKILVEDPQEQQEQQEQQEEKHEQILKGLILEAPFRSLREAALNYWAAYPLRMLPSSLYNYIFDFIPDRFETEAHLPSVASKIRVAILHGKKDSVVNSSQGRHLYIEGEKQLSSSSGSILFHEFERAGHNNVPFQKEFGSVLSQFLEPIFELTSRRPLPF